MHNRSSIPGPEGLYDPAHDHDACGVGFVADVAGKRSHDIVLKALQVLDNLDRKSTRLNSSHSGESRMPSSA